MADRIEFLSKNYVQFKVTARFCTVAGTPNTQCGKKSLAYLFPNYQLELVANLDSFRLTESKDPRILFICRAK